MKRERQAQMTVSQDMTLKCMAAGIVGNSLYYNSSGKL